MNPSNKPRVLVSGGSKHGATAEIARRIAIRLELDRKGQKCGPRGETQGGRPQDKTRLLDAHDQLSTVTD